MDRLTYLKSLEVTLSLRLLDPSLPVPCLQSPLLGFPWVFLPGDLQGPLGEKTAFVVFRPLSSGNAFACCVSFPSLPSLGLCFLFFQRGRKGSNVMLASFFLRELQLNAIPPP